jgi:hypothetical protein
MTSPSNEPRPLPVIAKVLLTLFALALVAPLIVYVSVFGVTISHDHGRWGEMGSAMSGIYSPVLAFLALLVVYGQLKSQNRFQEHEIDQRYIEQNRADIHFYLEQLDRALQVKNPNGATLRQMLHDCFLFNDAALFGDPKRIELPQGMNSQYPQLLGIWGAIYPVWVGLDSQKRFPYLHNAATALQKMIAVASYDTCVALDQYHRTLTEGRVKVPYQFSPLLGART